MDGRQPVAPSCSARSDAPAAICRRLCSQAARFCNPDPLNPASGPFKTFNDASQSYLLRPVADRTSGLGKDGMAAAYTDLKRHVICDSNKPHYCNEPASPLQASDSNFAIPSDQFLTAEAVGCRQLGTVGTSRRSRRSTRRSPLDGGEATASEGQFEALSDSDQLAVVTFLKTLQMPILPPHLESERQYAKLPVRRAAAWAASLGHHATARSRRRRDA